MTKLTMKQIRIFLILLSCVMTASLFITGCGSGNTGSSNKSASFDLATVQSEILKVAPKCKLEELEIAKVGKTQGFTNDYYAVNSLLQYLTDFSGVLPNPDKTLITYTDSGWTNSKDENLLSWNLNAVDKVYVCNTDGVPATELAKNLDAAWAEIDKYRGANLNECGEFYQPYDAQEAKAAKACLDKLKSLSRFGEWVVVSTTHGIEPMDLLTTFMSGLKKIYNDNPQDSRSPMAIGNGFIINFNPDYVVLSDTQIADRNLLWKSIVSNLHLKTWEKLDQDSAGFVGDYANFFSTEKQLMKVINREPEIIECNNPLKILENSAVASDCGKVKVSVFQSDLNTGECTFLANWNDKSGNSRIGIFRYCPTFTAGSIQENMNYSIRVRVTGPESYTTATGSESRVLAFTVLGN